MRRLSRLTRPRNMYLILSMNERELINEARKEGAKRRAYRLLGMIVAGKSLADAGAKLGISRQRAHQLLTLHYAAEYKAARR